MRAILLAVAATLLLSSSASALVDQPDGGGMATPTPWRYSLSNIIDVLWWIRK